MHKTYSNNDYLFKCIQICAIAFAHFTLSSCAHVQSSTPSEVPLSYIIRPIVSSETSRLQVELEFQGSKSGKTTLLLPDKWAGEEKYFNGIKDLKSLTPDTSIEPLEDPAMRLLIHKPNATLKIQYTVEQDWSGEMDEHRYRPIFDPNYFHYFGYAVFARPDFDDDTRTAVHLKWDMPDQWALSNSFGTNEKEQNISRAFGDVLHAVYVGGDFRINKVDISNCPIYVALRGKWAFPDSELVDVIGRIMHAERGFWNDYDFPYFLVTVLQSGSKCCDYAGTGLTQSFATFVALGDSVDIRLKNLLAHEQFHTWNGRKIKRKEPEQLVYWFSEGFTDYYTRLLNLRAGLISFPEYVTEYNSVLYRYYTSPVRNAPNERIKQDFWNNRYVEKLAYQRGNILAHEWNRTILSASKDRYSVDDFMHDLLHSAQIDNTLVSAESINALIKKYLPSGVTKDISTYIEKGDTIKPNADALGPCAHLIYKPDFPVDLGFDRAALKQGAILPEVTTYSNAYRAGLRKGMKVLEWHYDWFSSSKPARIKVEANSKAKWVEYLPAAQEKVLVPQYEIDEIQFKATPDTCLKWFRGNPKKETNNP